MLIVFFSIVSIKVKAALKPAENNDPKRAIVKTETRDALKGTIKSFLKWYRDNRVRLERFDLVTGTPGDTSQSYAVNFIQTELYLTELKKSGFVSGTYIHTFRDYFQTRNDHLLKFPQYDGPAFEFGFDQVTGIMEPEEILDKIDKLKITSKIRGNKASASINVSKYMELQINLTNINSDWLIDSIRFGPIDK